MAPRRKQTMVFFAAVYQKRPMRFRLHTKSASTGQVTTNTAALDALLQRVDELESAGGDTAGTISIVAGDNDVFVFRVTNNVHSDYYSDYDVIHPAETYTSIRLMPTPMLKRMRTT